MQKKTLKIDQFSNTQTTGFGFSDITRGPPAFKSNVLTVHPLSSAGSLASNPLNK